MRNVLSLISMAMVGASIVSAPVACALESTPPVVKTKTVSPKAAAKAEKVGKSCKLKPSSLISFDQSGGIAGVHKTFEASLKSMSKKDAGQICDLIGKSGLLKSKDVKNTNPNAADVFIYQFKVINGKDKHQATYDDTTLPESYRPLLEFFTGKAVDAGRT